MRTLFIIMPINETTSKVFALINQAIVQFKTKYEIEIEVFRSDTINEGGVIINQIKQHISESDIILTDITSDKNSTFNPNVFYEIGYAHGCSRYPILICRNLTDLTKLPFDISHDRVEPYDDNDTNLFLEKLESRLLKEINKTSTNNDCYGLWNAIYNYKETLKVDSELAVSNKLLLALYTNGLNSVKDTFKCTTYLTSSFWTEDTEEVYNSNKAMLLRLAKNNYKPVNERVERIFLLKTSLSDFLKEIGKEILECRKNGQTGLDDIRTRYNNLKTICKDFKKSGFSIKYCEEQNITHLKSPFKLNETEIAIYDDSRIDYYDGGSDGKISSVKIYTNESREFVSRHSELNRYFTNLSIHATDIQDLFDEIDNVYNYYSEKIDYDLKKLVLFDNDYYENDRAIKNHEINLVKNYLQNNKYKQVHSYLDIGTCTGRYPYFFDSLIDDPKCYITGIDADDDCYKYTTAYNTLRIKNEINNCIINFIESDFLKYDDRIDSSIHRYDLITCMLGTISHFGWNKDYKKLKENWITHDKETEEVKLDDLQKSLQKMHSLLTDGGLLIISNWSHIGLQSLMLEIYDENDRKKLRKYTEPSEVLEKRLQKLFDKVEVVSTTFRKLDIFFCTK